LAKYGNKIAFVASDVPEAEAAVATLSQRYGSTRFEDASVVVVLGGDGLMLQTLHRTLGRDVPAYGINFGSIGFLMNQFEPDGLIERLESALPTHIFPLKMSVLDAKGAIHEALALNEVSLFRSTFQAVKIAILVDGHVQLEELICDGVLLATPAGSTAYNLSAHGPILPIDSPLLALTPISPFRPRRWRGAILNNRAEVTFVVGEAEKRPATAVADNVAFPDAVRVTIREDRSSAVTLLFDPGHSLEERVLAEQFRF